ncbi:MULTISPECIES: DUF3043 domain-containing protein [unclassified Nocardioides]|uniref:DUF3043 domain-containing protein n=1 Tax=unclassified Nocardioides TaxID=2615069 RepID=UPI0006FDDDCF|nr:MULTISPECIES: DUF3043 domain-containing protein [unclassified Nocardioides]KQY63889.1 hypothetical protein ASD30_02595 [Nocardioides sp. Root140]KQZ69806.1 hypothetical protein ASD66_08835 [Nocardioides sp. Root151]KRF15903.1 hypothetical protein ASH02_04595 [Nocardioides sp. Soil796]
MFRRSSKDSPDSPESPESRPGSKGRPTPTRKEAEAAARARAKLPKDRKAQARRQRELRVESSRNVRAALRSGDEKNLPPRDRGPVKRFIRDFVDSRIGFSELLAPMLIIIMIMGYGLFGSGGMALANSLWFTTLVLVVLDILWMRHRVRKQVVERFPDESLKGVTWYAVMRSVNMRFLRLPKPQVKIGQALPEHYS